MLVFKNKMKSVVGSMTSILVPRTTWLKRFKSAINASDRDLSCKCEAHHKHEPLSKLPEQMRPR
jgi:hypothetical protein